jgi:hypothetical protein
MGASAEAAPPPSRCATTASICSSSSAPPYLPGRQYFAPSRELHELAPPATPWIFPADFLVEAARRLAGWRPDDVLRRLPSVDLRPTRPLADSGEALDVEAAIQAADEAAQVRQ